MAAKKKAKAKKRPVSKKKLSRTPKKKAAPVQSEFKKILLGIAILVSLCLSGAMVADIFLKPGRTPVKKSAPKTDDQVIQPIQDGLSPVVKKISPAKGLKAKAAPLATKKPATEKKAIEGEIEYEVFKALDPKPVEKPIPSRKSKIPEIAIIIDDIGYNRKVALALCDLSANITFSVLPFSPFGQSISENLYKKGCQLMLHLPMEPVEYPNVNPGPGAILSSMPPDILLAQLKKNIRNIPYVTGVNNHMGSRLTTSADQMNQIFTILKKENLFFIDSRTASKSQCKASARLLKIRFAQRDVFLDNLQDTEYIAGQFRELVRLARKHGSAIGIGHPYQVTLETLSRELPKVKNKIKLVRAKDLTHIPG